jgi:hypothetical protein
MQGQMIRRDYIIRMIEQFIRALAQLRALKQERRWDELAESLDEQFQRFVGIGAAVVERLNETELLARAIQGEPSLAVREKTLLLTGLLKEAGDLAVAREQLDEGRAWHLKGLHLLLGALGREESLDTPECVPRVEAFVSALAGGPLPLTTLAGLMQHYERFGEFGRAEDALFGMLEQEPDNAALVDFGLAFYERLLRQSKANLEVGNLPRPEVEAGLAELRGRKAAGQTR